MRRATVIIVTLLLVLPAAPAMAAGDGAGAGEVAIGIQATDVSGDEARFREDSLGERGALILELLRYERRGPEGNLRLDARYTAGGSGWFDLDLATDAWRLGLRTTLVGRWSDSSFADEVLPSGTPVSALPPGTTALDPLFGESMPNQTVIRFEGFATRRFSGASRITLRVGASSASGRRVPTIGGFSFSDVGTASFYTAGLEDVDASSAWADLEGRYVAGPLALSFAGGVQARSDDRTVDLPAYGRSGLLDLNRWDERLRTDVAWMTAGAGLELGAHRLRAAVSWTDVSSDPRGGDRRVDAGGALVAPGLDVLSGSLGRTAVSAALGWSWDACSHATLTVAADAQHRYGSGGLDLARRESPWTAATSVLDEKRAGGTVRASLRLGSARLRLGARAVSSETDVREARAGFSQDLQRSRDRIDARLDASVPLAEGLEFAAWARFRDDEVDVDLVDLWDGYVAGDWEREETAGSAALRYRDGRIAVSLEGAAWEADIDSGVPWYDPIFDPSLDLVPVSASSSARRLAASFAWSGERGSLWAEAGWLETEWDLGLGTRTGYAPLDETVSGTVVALGGETAPWAGGLLSARIEWVDEGDARAAELLRGAVRLEQEIDGTWRAFLRWGYWNLDNGLAPSDEYTANVLAAGARVSF